MFTDGDQSNYSGTDFRRLLQAELVRRCKANPRYSLRSFALSLKVSPAFLSMVLNSKRRLTPAAIKQMGTRLSLSPQQIEACIQAIQSRSSKKGGNDQQIDPHSSDYRQIALDHFQVIADWYHYAILELISVKAFEPNARWVAKALGISPSEATAAIERLIRLEFIKVDSKGNWINISGNNTNLDNEFVAIARRKMQKQILEKAIDALQELPIELRDQSSMTLAMDRRKLKEAKQRITDFRRELTQFLQSGPQKNRDEVFHMSLSLYPVTTLNRKQSSLGGSYEKSV